MAKERKFWGGMMPVRLIGKDTSGNKIDGEKPPPKASPPVAPAHGAKKPGTVIEPVPGKPTGKDQSK